MNLKLQAEGFPIEVLSKVMKEYTDSGFAKTPSKPVLGSMNEFTFRYKSHMIERYGGIENIKILGVNKDINKPSWGE